MLADLSAQQIDFVIDLVQPYQAHLQFENLIEDYFGWCTQQTKMNLSLCIYHHRIWCVISAYRIIIEDIYLNRKQLSRQIFLTLPALCNSFTGLSAISKCNPDYSSKYSKTSTLFKDLQIHALPIELPKINMGMYWHEHVKHNPRHPIFTHRILKIFNHT